VRRLLAVAATTIAAAYVAGEMFALPCAGCGDGTGIRTQSFAYPAAIAVVLAGLAVAAWLWAEDR
jgi:hypothetical protein